MAGFSGGERKLQIHICMYIRYWFEISVCGKLPACAFVSAWIGNRKQHLYFHISSPRIMSSLFSRKIRIRMIRNIANKEGENSFNIRYVYLPFIDIRFQWYRFAYNILLTYVLTFFGSIRYANYNPIVYRISIYRQVLSQYIKFHDTIL